MSIYPWIITAWLFGIGLYGVVSSRHLIHQVLCLVVIALREGYPINVTNVIQNTPEVGTIFCATANPVEVIVAETEQGRGVLGVIDGSSPKGIETEADAQHRQQFLRKIGYKR